MDNCPKCSGILKFQCTLKSGNLRYTCMKCMESYEVNMGKIKGA